jgi:hypothetical protein
MKKVAIILFFSLLLAIPANAAIFKWLDQDGVVHYVDDLHKVPMEYRHQLGLDLEELEREAEAVRKGGIRPIKAEPDAPARATIPEEKRDPAMELFGDKTLDWWRRTFSRVRRERSELANAISSKEEFIEAYEGGRSFGKIYTERSTERYNNYKELLPEEKVRLAKKEIVLEDLLRRAKNASVPRAVRGE